MARCRIKGRLVDRFRRLLTLTILGVLMTTRGVWAGPCCVGHGHVIGCEASIAGARCSDGEVTKGCACIAPKRKKPHPQKQLRFVSSTSRGQVLTPGEKPPTTTLKESVKN